MDALTVLASHGEPHLTGWYLGFAIAGAVIVVVVILVASILTLAQTIGKQARDINDSLRESYNNTAALAELRNTINHADVIVEGLHRARMGLGGR